MKKFYSNERYRISIIISILIVLGFTSVVAVNYSTYSSVIKEDIRNITKLSSSNIYSEINNELIKPIYVSLTMANDSFLIQWLSDEDHSDVTALQDYLIGIEQKYDYSSVFLVSEESNNYYHYNGVHKQISKDNAHDQWYYLFIDSEKNYDLDVDRDEVTGSTTVFVNCRILDENNRLLGVVGVGLEMNEVQEILGNFEDAYGLEAFMIDDSGLIQIHTSNRLIETHNISTDTSMKAFMTQIIENQSTMESFRYVENNIDGYLNSRYVQDLEWYLIVKKDTSVLRSSFDAQLEEEFIILAILIFGVVVVSHGLIKRHETKLSTVAKTDQLTSLPNRRGFDYRLFDALKDAGQKGQSFSVFIFDIDHFKNINDTHGHLFGDRTIEQIARYVLRRIGSNNTLARWGGDEFSGIIYGDYDSALALLSSIVKGIHDDSSFSSYNITISVGITASRPIDTPDTIIARADKALYIAKTNGKNQVSQLN